MKFKIKLQRLFKKIFQKIFIFFYGKIFYRNDYNFLLDNPKNEIKKVSIEGLIYNCFIINNGILYTDLVENVSIISRK